MVVSRKNPWNLLASLFLKPYKEISASRSFPRNLCIAAEIVHKLKLT